MTTRGTGIPGGHFFQVPTPTGKMDENARVGYYESYRGGFYEVDFKVFRNHHMRRNLIWRDHVAKGAEQSTCLSLTYVEQPPGFRVRNTCGLGPQNAAR